MSNLFGDFDLAKNMGNPTDDSEGTENKGFELLSYSEYLEKEDIKKNKNKAYVIPKVPDSDYLKIVPFKTNKHGIEQRKLMKENVIPRHASAVLFNGRSGSGKSNLLVNLFRPQFYGRTKKDDPKSAYFDLVFLFSPTCHNDDLAKYLELPQKRMFDSNYEKALKHIVETQRQLVNRLGVDKSPKVLIVFDDIQSQRKFMNSPYFTLCFIQNRHINISTWVCCQSFTRLPRICRLQANNLFVFAGSNSETDVLAEEFCPAHTSKKQFLELLKHATSKQYDFLHINMRENADRRFRRNLDNILKMNNN